MTDFQHDYVLDDAPGASVRADINAALLAIAHKNQGASQPSATFSLLEWGDITANLLKRRNAANNGWIIYDTLAESFLTDRSSNTIITVSDYKKSFVATAAFTQTFTAVANLPDGWYCDYKNDSSGNVILDPNSTELIDGASTITLLPGQACRIYSNGSALKTMFRSTFALPLSGGTLTGDVTLAENVGLVLDAALSADGKYSGIVEAGTSSAALAFGEIIYRVTATGKWAKAKADVVGTSGLELGICVLAAAGADAAIVVLKYGKVRADSLYPTFTIGASVYISAATAGLPTSTAPTGTTDFVVRKIGHAEDGDTIFFNPSNDYVTLS
jgi:hypothetical protein